MKLIRVLLALAFGLFATALMAVLVYVAWPFGWSLGVLQGWARVVHRVCIIGLLRIQMDVAMHRDDLYGRNVMITSTHPSILETVAFYCSVIDHVAKDVIIVAKKAPWYDIPYHLFVALPLKAVGTAIIVDRSSAERTVTSIRQELARRNGNKVAVLVLTYNTRPTAARIARDRKKFAAKIPRTVAKLKHTTIPRVSAEHAIREALDGDTCVIKVTSAMNVANEGIHHALRVYGATFHFRAEQTDTPRGLKSLQRWHNIDCESTNDRIAYWRTKRP